MRNIVNKDSITSLINDNVPKEVPEEVSSWFKTTYLNHILSNNPVKLCLDASTKQFISDFLDNPELEHHLQLCRKGKGKGKSKAKSYIRDIPAVLFEGLEGIEVIDAPWVKHNTIYHRIESVRVEQIGDLCDLMQSEWFAKYLSKLGKMSYKNVIKKHEEWLDYLHKKSSTEEDFDGLQTLYEFPNGNKVVKLTSRQNYIREGTLQRNCASSYFPKRHLWSLRTSENKPLITFEVEDGDTIIQARGFANKVVSKEKWKELRPFLMEKEILVVLGKPFGMRADDDVEEDEDWDEEDDDDEEEEEEEFEEDDGEDDDDEEEEKPCRRLIKRRAL